MRVLVSARDVGAARHMMEIVPALRLDSDLDIQVVADDPAWSLLEQHGLHPMRFAATAVADGHVEGPGATALRSAARDLLDTLRPDAVLIGLSGPGVGVDEALVAEAGTIPTYAIQDYPGWVVDGFGVRPGTYFVDDAEAMRFTAKRAPTAEIVVAGSAKYAAYGELDLDILRAEGRTPFASSGTGAIIGFYGQPLWFLPGYERTIAGFAAATVAACPNARMFYRPHPKEDAGQRQRIMDIFRDAGVDAALDPNHAAEQSLAAVDVLVTCFSSCAMDLSYLQRFARKPLGVTLFLLTENDIRNYHAQGTGMDTPPGATLDLALMATDAIGLADLIRTATSPNEPSKMWLQARAVLPDPMRASTVILETLRGDNVRSRRMQAQGEDFERRARSE